MVTIIVETIGSSGNPGAGFRNSCPDVIIKGGSGWNPIGRGKNSHVPHGSGSGSYIDTTRTINDQYRGQSWWGNTRGRGTAQGNSSGYYGSTNHFARTNSNPNGKFWSVRSPDSGSSGGSHTMNKWGEPQ